MSLSGKNVLITGGGTGTGEAVALALAREGARVAITGRREERLAAVAARFSRDGASGNGKSDDRGSDETPIIYRAADVSNRDDVKALFEWFAGELGPLHILVNSAGINIPNRKMEVLTPEDWDKILAVNATGAFNMFHAALPQMRERRDGIIVNISSVAGIRASVLGGVAYSAAKFAMSALGLTVNLEENKNGIRVTNIYPGEINTPILDARPVPVSDEHKAQILQPEDLAAAVLLVAKLPPRANVPELVIKPTSQPFA